MKIKTNKIIEIVKGKKINFKDDIVITGISTDTRSIDEKSNLFIPLVGENFDAHNFINDAFDKGCDLTLTSTRDINKPAILVKDTKKAMMDIAEYYREKIDPMVISIVGSVGKTTTKEIIYNVIKNDYNTLKTHLNLNNEIGVPLTIFNLKQDDEVLLLELGMNHFGEMENLSKIAKPDIIVFTNIGSSHLGNFESVDEIFQAKLEVLEYFNKNGKIIINNDNDLLRERFLNSKYDIYKYGVHNDALYRTIDYRFNGIFGNYIKVKTPRETYEVNTKALGNHLIYNILPAVIIGEILDINKEKIEKGITEYRDTTKRMELVDLGSVKIINDAYNASYESMVSAIQTLTDSKCAGEKIAILGEILELGDFSEKIHFELGEFISDAAIDKLICIGGNTKYIHKAAKSKGFEKTYFFKDKEEFKMKYKALINKGDLILIKGSRSTKMETIIDIINF